jgi:serine/threonine protein kinase
MSPEQVTAQAVDARTDQYSLATVLYEMLAGEPVICGTSEPSLDLQVRVRAVRPVRIHRSKRFPPHRPPRV